MSVAQKIRIRLIERIVKEAFNTESQATENDDTDKPPLFRTHNLIFIFSALILHSSNSSNML